jgi:hypothetical protein
MTPQRIEAWATAGESAHDRIGENVSRFRWARGLNLRNATEFATTCRDSVAAETPSDESRRSVHSGQGCGSVWYLAAAAAR